MASSNNENEYEFLTGVTVSFYDGEEFLGEAMTVPVSSEYGEWSEASIVKDLGFGLHEITAKVEDNPYFKDVEKTQKLNIKLDLDDATYLSESVPLLNGGASTITSSGWWFSITSATDGGESALMIEPLTGATDDFVLECNWCGNDSNVFGYVVHYDNNNWYAIKIRKDNSMIVCKKVNGIYSETIDYCEVDFSADYDVTLYINSTDNTMSLTLWGWTVYSQPIPQVTDTTRFGLLYGGNSGSSSEIWAVQATATDFSVLAESGEISDVSFYERNYMYYDGLKLDVKVHCDDGSAYGKTVTITGSDGSEYTATTSYNGVATVTIDEITEDTTFTASCGGYTDSCTVALPLIYDKGSASGISNYGTIPHLEGNSNPTYTISYDSTEQAYLFSGECCINALTGVTDDFALMIDMKRTVNNEWCGLEFVNSTGNGFFFGGYGGYWQGHYYQNNSWKGSISGGGTSSVDTWYHLMLEKFGNTIHIVCFDEERNQLMYTSREYTDADNYYGMILTGYFKNVYAYIIPSMG